MNEKKFTNISYLTLAGIFYTLLVLIIIYNNHKKIKDLKKLYMIRI